ncbi:type II toxin-antitoxin system PemK/MazF family toxin [Candidatus Nitrospira nitrificans]|uniref:mRNA interferase n=1 Tax=Candidatus Nitrospira nitrificans TaxID=1742973 RepID=A0A0S4LPQ3_9BACT|nr:type II toxin-antitoxin system PemK/MazF family toxin [Candidatus Nitrospira nitrificans]CUS38666.1 mRNA interferase [Candidatus Nitrospira nitrificans]
MARVRKLARRGDVYWVVLDPTVGSEVKKTRPAVIVSNNSCNTFGSRVVVVPLTSNVDSLYPGEAMVVVDGKPARVLGDQIRSLDKSRLRSRIDTLSHDELAAVEDAVRITLALRP